MPVHPDPFVHPAPPVYPSHSVHAARLPASAETGGCQGPVRFGDAKGRGRAPWWVLGVALLSWGCAAPAESADLDEAALEGEEAAATEMAPLDPVGRYLAVAVSDPERETALLDSLRSVVRDALDDRHPRARRLEAVEEADRYLRELAAVEESGLGGSGLAVHYRIAAPDGEIHLVNVHLETPRKGLESLRYGMTTARVADNTILRGIGSRRVFASLGDDLGGPPRLGQTLIAIRPGSPGFAARIETLLSDMAAQPGVRIPGERRHANRRRNEAEGVTVDADLMSQLHELRGHH